MKLGELLVQHRTVDPDYLLLRREGHVDDVEPREQSIRDDVATSTGRSHRCYQLHLLDVLPRLLPTIVPADHDDTLYTYSSR